MLSEAQQFWDAIKGKVRQLIRSETDNTYRCERYEVTTVANGSKMGVTLPMGDNEIFLPYSREVARATVGTPVIVVWWKSMSNAKVCYFADGYRGVGRKFTCFTLLNGASASAGTVSTYSQRKLSDYDVIFAEWIVNSGIRATGICYRGTFQSANYFSLFYVDSSNVQRYCEIKYVSDTSVNVSCSSNASGSIYLYGLENY